MASITIRNIDKSLKEQPRIKAAKYGRSMEEEVQTILKMALAEESTSSGNLAQNIRQRFKPLGDVDRPKTPREPILDWS